MSTNAILAAILSTGKGSQPKRNVLFPERQKKEGMSVFNQDVESVQRNRLALYELIEELK